MFIFLIQYPKTICHNFILSLIWEALLLFQLEELWSNSANKFFDTLAAGKPILINYGGWQKEIIHKENIGYTMPIHITSRDVKKFYKYTQNKSLIAKQKENALNIATNCFATDIALKKYNKIVKDILKIKSENT